MSRLSIFGLCGGLILAATIAGCGPRLSDEELGEVQVAGDRLPGADVEYTLPAPEFDPDKVDPSMRSGYGAPSSSRGPKSDSTAGAADDEADGPSE